MEKQSYMKMKNIKPLKKIQEKIGFLKFLNGIQQNLINILKVYSFYGVNQFIRQVNSCLFWRPALDYSAGRISIIPYLWYICQVKFCTKNKKYFSQNLVVLSITKKSIGNVAQKTAYSDAILLLYILKIFCYNLYIKKRK